MNNLSTLRGKKKKIQEHKIWVPVFSPDGLDEKGNPVLFLVGLYLVLIWLKFSEQICKYYRLREWVNIMIFWGTVVLIVEYMIHKFRMWKAEKKSPGRCVEIESITLIPLFLKYVYVYNVYVCVGAFTCIYV